MIDMTKAEVLAIWKGFVRNMSDQGAVFPFANEIARLARNEMLDRLEAVEKECDALHTEVARWKGLSKQLGNEAEALRAKIETMERARP